jgi:hypothetical protein
MATEATPAASLPADLRGLDKPALKQEIEHRTARRKVAQAELSQLAKQRDAYLKAHTKSSDEAFDTQVNAAIDHQLKP